MTGSAYVIGNSHIGALRRAMRPRRAALRPGEKLNIEAVNRRHDLFMPEFEKTPNGERLNSALVARFQPTVDDPNGIILSSIGGNQHNILGLARHSQPFDFVSPERPDLPIDDGAELIPYGVLRDVLSSKMKKEFKIIRMLRDLAPGRCYHLESPPPSALDNLGAAYIANWTENFGGKGAAPSFLRLKVWRLHSSIVRDFCESIGVVFVPAPAEAMDANGYRVDAATDIDEPSAVTHANAWYGELVLKQIDALIAEHVKKRETVAG